MTVQLSICIPTYNRAEFLRVCLETLVPQVRNRDDVEVIVNDNCSFDTTEEVVRKIQQIMPNLKYFKNPENLGYAGNQVECFRRARGQYMPFLCDDDVYLDGAVKRILEVIAGGEYAFIALNYYGFLRDKNKPFKSDFAPVKDVLFKRAYDIMNYPSVGHFSGFIFNLALARMSLDMILAKKDFREYEKDRGIINEVAVRSTLSATLPAYFIGKRLLAGHMPGTVDYDSLKHCCIDYYENYLGLFREGLITENDLAYRRSLVLSKLPKAIISNAPRLNRVQLEEVVGKLKSFFAGNKKFESVCLPLLWLARIGIFRLLFSLVRETAYLVKKIQWRLCQ